MKHSSFLLPAAGFVIAVGCALAPRPALPPPYFGYDPATKLCKQGTIEGACGGGFTVQCTVTIGSFTGIAAYDTRSNATLCTQIVYKPTSQEPPDPDTLTLN